MEKTESCLSFRNLLSTQCIFWSLFWISSRLIELHGLSSFAESVQTSEAQWIAKHHAPISNCCLTELNVYWRSKWYPTNSKYILRREGHDLKIVLNIELHRFWKNKVVIQFQFQFKNFELEFQKWGLPFNCTWGFVFKTKGKMATFMQEIYINCIYLLYFSFLFQIDCFQNFSLHSKTIVYIP